MVKYKLEDVEKAYHTFSQLANQLYFKKEKKVERVKDSRGIEFEKITWEIRSNSRIILANEKDEARCDYLVFELNDRLESLLNSEYDKFTEALTKVENSI